MSAGATRRSFSPLGVGAAACIACCAGPLIAVLGGITVAGVAGTVAFGAVAAVLAVIAAGVVFLRRRRRRAACESGVGESVQVDAPRRRVPSR